MKPINFECSTKFTLSVCKEHQEQGVQPMVAVEVVFGDGRKSILECWRPTWKELFWVIVTRKVWLFLMADKTHVPPVMLFGGRTPFAGEEDSHGD